MTPREFQWRYNAARARDRRAFEDLAQLACWVMNPWLKKPITVKDLIAPPAPLTGEALWTALAADGN